MFIVIGTDNRDRAVERIHFAKSCHDYGEAQAVLTTQLCAELKVNDLAYWFELKTSESSNRYHNGFVLVNYEGQTIEYTIKEEE